MRTDIRKGYVKGEPLRFVKGHNNRLRLGAANPRWLGDTVGYDSLHAWLRLRYPLTGICEECGATGKRTELSNRTHIYTRDIADYRELCSRCHCYYDHDELGQFNPCLDRAVAA